MTNSKYAQDFCKILQCNTVTDGGDFDAFHNVLKQVFPLLHTHLQKVDLSSVAGNRNYADVLLFKWDGISHDNPLVLMAHQDVVPADEKGWTYPPFDAKVVDGKVYARGALDCKSALFCTMMAVEELLSQEKTPLQDVYLSYSHNEEISGDGAEIVRDFFVANNVTPFLVVDEGGALMKGDGKIFKKDLLMVGACEKGYADVKFIARGNGGHSCRPPLDTPIARISAFVNYCEHHTVFKPKCSKIAKQMVYHAGDVFPFYLKALCKIVGPFGGLVAPLMCKRITKRKLAMVLTTTMAFTTVGGGDVPNSIPDEAWVTANLRFLQGDTSTKCFARLQKLAKKFNLEMEVIKYYEPSKVVDINGEGYKFFQNVAKQVYPNAVVAPLMMFGSSDCRHMQPIAKHAIRCLPLSITFSQLDAMHGNDENIDLSSLDDCIDFYKKLIQQNN